MKLSTWLAVLLVAALALAAWSYGRSRTAERLLVAQTDSASQRVLELRRAVVNATLREGYVLDSLAQSRAQVTQWRALAGAERGKSDSLLAFLKGSDSPLVPLPVVLHMAASLHLEIVLRDSIIATDSLDLLRLERLYHSADSGRAAALDLLDDQRVLTAKWRRVAQPPLFSLRRFTPVVGCVTGYSAACGVGLAYRF